MTIHRQQIILDYLEEHSSVNVVDLSKMLHVSEVTVRKILDSMQKQGLLRRTWGGAVSLSSSVKELEHENKSAKHVAEKREIAQKAYSFIEDGDAIYLDSGSTNMELAKLLVSGPRKGLVVGTNAINIACELSAAPNIEVYVTGGVLRRKAMSCVGPMAEEALKGVYYDKGFISTYHCTLKRGLTTPNAYEAHFKRCLMQVCKEKFSLADHSKFGNDSMMHIADAQEMDYIITDGKLEPGIVAQFQDAGANLLVADKPG